MRKQWRAYTAVKRAVEAGDLTKGPCEECGAAIAHAHHDDYSKPLEVRWLCIGRARLPGIGRRGELAVLNAECGSRNAEYCHSAFRIPHSHFRISFVILRGSCQRRRTQ